MTSRLPILILALLLPGPAAALELFGVTLERKIEIFTQCPG